MLPKTEIADDEIKTIVDRRAAELEFLLDLSLMSRLAIEGAAAACIRYLDDRQIGSVAVLAEAKVLLAPGRDRFCP